LVVTIPDWMQSGLPEVPPTASHVPIVPHRKAPGRTCGPKPTELSLSS
jgi:hypothetical protein